MNVLDKVTKLLRLSESPNLNEAGQAARRACQLILKFKLEFKQVASRRDRLCMVYPTNFERCGHCRLPTSPNMSAVLDEFLGEVFHQNCFLDSLRFEGENQDRMEILDLEWVDEDEL